MPFPVFDPELLQQHVNRAIAELLASDPGNASYLGSLDNTAIAVEVLNPGWQFLITFDRDQVLFQPLRKEDQPQLRIKGSALNLMKLLNTPVDSASKLRQLGIEVSGDVGLLLEISQLANRIEIDWEYLLSVKLGETPAVLISRAVQTAQTQALKTRADLEIFIRKQLKEHSNLPTQSELESTRHELRELNYRLDRLELAIKQGKH